MKRLISILFLCLSLHTKTIFISDQCEQIHQRMYLVRRLEGTISALHTLNHKLSIDSFVLEQHPFEHPMIKEVITAINSQKNLQPLFDLWGQFTAYKKLSDEQFVQEFIGLLFTTMIQLDDLRRNIKRKAVPIPVVLSGVSFTEALAQHLYQVQRLKKPLDFLKNISCQKNDLFDQDFSSSECDCTFIRNYTFSHAEINRCIKQIIADRSMVPITHLAADFINFKFIHDKIFQKEFMLLIFTAYRNLLINNALRFDYTVKKSTAALFNFLYENAEKISLEQILDAIDTIADELPSLLKKNRPSTAERCKEFAKKYWWGIPSVFTPPLIVYFLYTWRCKKTEINSTNQKRDNKIKENKRLLQKSALFKSTEAGQINNLKTRLENSLRRRGGKRKNTNLEELFKTKNGSF